METMCTEVNDFESHFNNVFKNNIDERQFSQSVKHLRKNILLMNDVCKAAIKYLYSHDWSIYSYRQSKRLLKLIMDVFTAYPHTIKDGMCSLIHSIHTISLLESSDQLNNQICKFISTIVDIFPITWSHIVHVLTENLPYHSRPKSYVLNYFKILFTLVKMIPSFKRSIYNIIFQGIINIDTEVPRKMFDSAEKFFTEVKERRISLSAIHSKLKESDRKSVFWLETVDKLDDLLQYAFVMLTSEYEKYRERGMVAEFYRDLYEPLCLKILPCRGLVGVHFIWFYFSGIDQEFMALLLKDLWSKAVDVNEPVYIRQSSAVFLGGILARSSCMSSVVFKEQTKLISAWLLTYLIDKVSPTSDVTFATNRTFGFHPHHIFYVICQSLFYALIYKDKFVALEDEGYDREDWVRFLASLSIERIIITSINPLYYCATDIVDKIAEIGKKYEIFYAYSVISRNKRLNLLTNHREASCTWNSELNILDLGNACNFPFDPYNLPSTRSLIQPIYRKW